MLFPLLSALAVIAVLLWRQQRLAAALRAARAGEARLRLVAEHGNEILWMMDCAGTELLYVSPAAQQHFGYDAAQSQQQATRLAAGLPQRIARFRAGDASRRRLVRQLDLAHSDGRAIAVEITSTLITDAAGQPSCVVGALRDVSAARAQELAQQRFASMLSHEFRTPLATIDGAIQRLEVTGAQADEATRKRYRKIQTAVERLLAMIDDYLSPARMAAIGRTRQPDTADPQALLEQAAARAGAAQHRLTVRAEGLPRRVRCDSGGMLMCLQILLDNAALYAPAGTPIELAGSMAPEGGVQLLVSDRGPGVPDDELARVFEKNFRGRIAQGKPGAGRGLYMARTVVEAHGGTLSVEKRAGGGAAFRIWLPFQGGAGKYLASGDCNSDNSSR